MESKLGKGIIRILIANILNMFISILTNLILPKNLSVETYAAIKTYHLYLTYVGILHLGFTDGIYLKYGGKNFEQIDWSKIHTSAYSFRIFQMIIVVIGAFLAILLHEPILIIVSIMVLPTNMMGFYKYLYQACGEYHLYSKVVNGVSIATFIVNILLVLIIKTDNYNLYLGGYLFVNILIWSLMEYSFQNRYKKIEVPFIDFSLSELVRNMKDGIFLTLGNFASTLTTSMDRWFVKFLIGTVGFAQYSFAVSMENFLNTAITPVSITLYNTLCADKSYKSVKRYREFVVLFATMIVASAFLVKFIVTVYLKKYCDSINVIFLLFSSQIYYIVTKSIYVNLYKANRQQNKYFKKLVLSLMVGIAFNTIAYFINNTNTAYAFATALTAVFWFILVQIDFPKDKISIKEILYMLIATCTFLYLGFNCNAITGFLIYVIIIVISSIIFMKKPAIESINIIKKMINHKLKT